jgi:hypothetical protein
VSTHVARITSTPSAIPTVRPETIRSERNSFANAISRMKPK